MKNPLLVRHEMKILNIKDMPI